MEQNKKPKMAPPTCPPCHGGVGGACICGLAAHVVEPDRDALDKTIDRLACRDPKCGCNDEPEQPTWTAEEVAAIDERAADLKSWVESDPALQGKTTNDADDYCGQCGAAGYHEADCYVPFVEAERARIQMQFLMHFGSILPAEQRNRFLAVIDGGPTDAIRHTEADHE